MMLMHLDNGVQASYTQCHYTPDYWWNYMIIGTEGRIENFSDSGGGHITLWNRRSNYSGEGNAVFPIPGDSVGHADADVLMVSEFCEFLTRGAPTSTSPHRCEVRRRGSRDGDTVPEGGIHTSRRAASQCGRCHIFRGTPAPVGTVTGEVPKPVHVVDLLEHCRVCVGDGVRHAEHVRGGSTFDLIHTAEKRLDSLAVGVDGPGMRTVQVGCTQSCDVGRVENRGLGIVVIALDRVDDSTLAKGLATHDPTDSWLP